LTFFDAGFNIPVAESVSYKLNACIVKTFIQESMAGQPAYSITTDDRKFYRKIVRELNCTHQLCGFHFLKHVTEDADWYFTHTSLSDAEKIRVAVCVSLLREVFRSFTIAEFEDKFQEVFDMIDTVPYRIKKHIKKLARDFDLYTAHFFNPYIPRTTNQLENYYRQTDPKKTKNQHKTAEGLLQALNQKAVFWVIRNGFISKEDSLKIARKNLSTTYDNATIEDVFSKKKKHVLTYWMGDPTQ
jgi:hypothetical protein